MNSQDWVRQNCKFAQVEPLPSQQPQPPLAQGQPAPAPEPDAQLDAIWSQYWKSFDNLKVISETDDSDVESIEEDRFDPGSQYGHYTESVGAVNLHDITQILRGKLYIPEILRQTPDFQEIGDIGQNIIFNFTEGEPPPSIWDEIHTWNETKVDYKILNLVQEGDWFDVTIKCEASGQSDYEPPEREYEPDY